MASSGTELSMPSLWVVLRSCSVFCVSFSTHSDGRHRAAVLLELPIDVDIDSQLYNSSRVVGDDELALTTSQCGVFDCCRHVTYISAVTGWLADALAISTASSNLDWVAWLEAGTE